MNTYVSVAGADCTQPPIHIATPANTPAYGALQPCDHITVSILRCKWFLALFMGSFHLHKMAMLDWMRSRRNRKLLVCLILQLVRVLPFPIRSDSGWDMTTANDKNHSFAPNINSYHIMDIITASIRPDNRILFMQFIDLRVGSYTNAIRWLVGRSLPFPDTSQQFLRQWNNRNWIIILFVNSSSRRHF